MNTTADPVMPEDDALEDDGITLTDQLVESVAYVAAALAAMTPASKHHQIPILMRDWTRAEVRLAALQVKDLNSGLTEAEKAAVDALEKRIGRAILTFVKGSLPNPKIDLSGDPRGGTALRLVWDDCDEGQPRNAFAGGLVVLV